MGGSWNYTVPSKPIKLKKKFDWCINCVGRKDRETDFIFRIIEDKKLLIIFFN